MSDFFGALSGARFPDVVMNSGPLPPEGGLPAPLHDTADARINYGSTLLGDLSPYAYGEPGYQSSQVSYVNHPHRIQKIFPPLLLPTASLNSTNVFQISHPVDDSDIAFVMRLDRGSTFCTMLGNRSLHRHSMGTAIDPYINLCTLNYLLAGLQLFYVQGNGTSKWFELLHDLDKERFPNANRPINLADLHYIIRELITPFGVVRGSEKQGGQNEVGLSAATWPVTFAGTLVIDGKERNIVNYWHFHEINAGDDLVFRLKPMPIPFDEGYTLNHYYKNVSRQDFSRQQAGGFAALDPTHVWQLVPDIFDLEARPDTLTHGMRLPTSLTIDQPYYWQQHGYWHIGRTQVMFRKYGEKEYYSNDMVNNLKINHLDMTFEPCFLSAPGPHKMGSHVTWDRDAHGNVIPVGGVGGGNRFLCKPAAEGFGDAWHPHLGLEFHGRGMQGLKDAMDLFAMPPPSSFIHPDDVFIDDEDDAAVRDQQPKRARAGEGFLSRFAPPPPLPPAFGGGGLGIRDPMLSETGPAAEMLADAGADDVVIVNVTTSASAQGVGMHGSGRAVEIKREEGAVPEEPALTISGAVRGEEEEEPTLTISGAVRGEDPPSLASSAAAAAPRRRRPPQPQQQAEPPRDAAL